MSTARSIKAVLELDSNRYIAGMTRAKSATRDFSAAARGDFDRTRKGYDGMGSAVAGGGKYVAGLSRAKAATREFAREVTDLSAKQRQSLDDVSRTSLIAGGAIGGGLALMTRETINWESAWAGVTKTTEGSDAQMAQLEEQLRGLTKVLPATHEEIAGVAESAGQLGIAREDLIGFTETAIALGESTNLSADEAAEGLAKISNVMGTSAQEGVAGYEKLGNVLVALGNDGASTERDIVSMAQRLTGASKIAGITEGELLALSNAMSSVGIESELGGGAMSRAILEMNSAVASGGGTLETFAKTSGLTADQFAARWKADPVSAIQSFVIGLEKVNASGGDVKQVLADAGLAGTQNAQVLLRLAGASDVLTDSLELQGTEWENGAALQDEAAKRYETTASRMQIAQNGMRDAAIDAGSVLAPIAASGAEKIAGLADAFVKLPTPVQNTATGLATVTAASLLTFGAVGKTVVAVSDLRSNLSDMSGALGGTGGKMASFAKGATYATAMLVAMKVAGDQVDEMVGNVEMGSEEAASVLLDLQKNGMDASSASATMKFRYDDLAETMQYATKDAGVLGSTLEGLSEVGTLGGVFGPTERDETSTFLKNVDAGLVQLMNTGRQAEAMNFWDEMVAGTDGSEQAINRLKDALPGFTSSLDSAGNAADGAGGAVAGMAGDLDTNADGFVDATEAAAGYADEIEDLAGSITKMGGGFRAEQQAISDFDAAVQDASKAVSGTADEQEAALRGIAQTALAVAGAQIEMGRGADVVGSSMTDARSKFLAVAQSMGYSKSYARELADAMGLIPRDVVAEVKAAGVQESTARVLKMNDSIKLLNDKTVSVKEEGANPSTGRVKKMDGAIFGLDGKTVTVTEIGTTAAGDRVVRFGGKVYALQGKTVDINANTGQATSAIAGVQSQLNMLTDKSVTLTTTHRTIYQLVGGAPSTSAPGVRLDGRADGGVDLFGGGRHVQAFANGGTFDPDRPWDTTLGRMQPGIKPVTQRGILMAEEGAGPWEAFISGHPGKVDRSKAIASDVVRMLGGQVSWNPDERLIAAMASGGVYGDWQAALRNVKRLKGQYRRTLRFEDGSSKYEDPIAIFEDGTARWQGYNTAPGSVSSAIARLNAAQDRYEDAKRKPKGQHSAEYYETKRRQAENARNRYGGKHSAEYYETKRRQEENARRRGQGSGGSGKITGPRKLKMLGPEVGGGDGIGLPKLGSYRYPGRDASTRSVSSSPYYQGATSSGFGRVTAGASTGSGQTTGPSVADMQKAFTAAMATMRPLVQIDGRTFNGVMKDVTRTWKGR
ncbi:phage tail tape measure protein [Janibacter melonis]|uniref:phage tail tape measure protein n=1 Tax=Janibacter melonis TaxID=262209 RepID=UPI002043C400|nr:phage tail tape measure protein [Janibacter melonis]MCM3554537.1 phage tail tape measure protein [Janibacter melonis]